METREDFKRVVESINQLEQLLSISEDALMNERYDTEAEEEIERYFSRCEVALAARKGALLIELEMKVIVQKKTVVDAKEELNKAIIVRRKILETGSYVYESDIKSAEQVWKGAMNLPYPQASIGRMKLELSNGFFELIQNIGKVETYLLYHPTVEKKTYLEKTLQNSGELALEENFVPPENIPHIKECDYSIAREITTLAGSAPGFIAGKGDQVKFNSPYGICWNPHDKCLYVCDTGNSAIRRCTLQGQVSTFAHKGLLSEPRGIVVHHKSNTFFVTDSATHTVCSMTATGDVRVLAGDLQGIRDGRGTSAFFDRPYGIAIDQRNDTIYLSDHHTIRKISLQGVVSTIAGSGIKRDADGTGIAARFDGPRGLCFDEKHQSLLVCDYSNNKIKRVSLKGDVSTLCGIGYPFCVMVANNTILVSAGGAKIFRVTEAGEASIFQQHAERKTTKECIFNRPRGLALDDTSNTCFVVDYGDNVIKKITF